MVDLDEKVLSQPETEQGIAGLAGTDGNQHKRNRLGEAIVDALGEAGICVYPALMTCLCPPIGIKLWYELARYGPRRALREIRYEDRQCRALLQGTG
jgi:hypothetical protein